MTTLANFGVVGLAVMGRNLSLNLADHGFKVAVINREPEMTDSLVEKNPDKGFVPAKSYPEFVASIEQPRRILLMVMAGAPVDDVLSQLKPLLAPGDVVIDGGNTLWTETERREKDLAEAGIHFVGMGVSGGEEGARNGPSLMPGGKAEAWTALKPVLEAISAKSKYGPCVTHVGPGGAGHFVKMVHNGIEYGDMQLLAEAYDLLGRGAGLGAAKLSEVFAGYNRGPMESFLVDLTAKVLAVVDPETKKPLVDLVEDKAGQKGTGRWTAQIALELGVAIPTIAAAIDARVLSAAKKLRTRGEAELAAKVLAPTVDADSLVADVESALLFAKVSSYAQGLHLIQAQATAQKWTVDLREIARIWTGGCIIRAALLGTIMEAYEKEPTLEHLFFAEAVAPVIAERQEATRRVVALAASLGIPTPSLSASLSYFDALRTERLPQNLTQAQRDAFGAHTYTRRDAPERGAVHTDWLK